MDEQAGALEINTLPVDAELPEAVKDSVQVADDHLPHRGLSRRGERINAFHVLYAAEQHMYQDSLESITEMLRVFDIEISKDSHALLLARGAIEQREKLDQQMMPFLKNWRIERRSEEHTSELQSH